MKASRLSANGSILAWILLGIGGLSLLAWSFPRAFPFYPRPWTVSREEAKAIALTRLGDLAPIPANAFVVARLDDDSAIERRLQEAATRSDSTDLFTSWPARLVLSWEVVVYAPQAQPGDWSHRARVTAQGQVVQAQLRFDPDAKGLPLDAGEARRQADALLKEQGFDPARYGEPELRSQQLAARTDLTLRYADRDQKLGPRCRYGLEVTFAGDQLAGFAPFFEDPDRAALDRLLQPAILINNLHLLAIFLLMPVVGFFFLRRYHAGEIGVKRGVQIFLLTFFASAAMLVLVVVPATQGFTWGALSRSQVTWAWGLQMALVFFLPLSLVSALSWSVGESLSRERWGQKLAAFDALWQWKLGNATVARSALRGLAAGLAIAGGLSALLLPLAGQGVWAPASFQLGPWWDDSAWPGITLILFVFAFTLYYELFGRLFLLSALVGRLGRFGGGLVAAVLAALLFFPPLFVLPTSWSLAFWLLWAAAGVVLFLRFDLLTALISGYTVQITLCSWPFLTSQNPSLAFQGSIALLSCAAPLLLSIRWLGSEKEFVYRYDDVPPHVRRIAERERQRVELETARNIQSSILPELPPMLNGVEIAHAYRPATEVGGDFYDVLALEDGRLAVAVGDVAGHGVSSGLVMSMAKSALAVQVTFNPEVVAVFATLNRMVYQSARKRLLATLCYALLDRERRELTFASAGHLFPYRVSNEGKVEALESVSYPLGVRPQIEVHPRVAHLAAGDLVVLFSDGVVEARPEASEELFGFDRLEASLARQAGKGAIAARNGLLGDLAGFVGDASREDDLTLLVLRVP